MCLSELWFSLGICPVMGLPGHMVVLFLVVWVFLNFFLLFLAVLGLCCCARASSSSSEQGLLFVAVHGLLIVVASLVAEHRQLVVIPVLSQVGVNARPSNPPS